MTTSSRPRYYVPPGLFVAGTVPLSVPVHSRRTFRDLWKNDAMRRVRTVMIVVEQILIYSPGPFFMAG